MECVWDFHIASNMPKYFGLSKESLKNREERKNLRIKLIAEEFNEYLEAEMDDDIVEIADALADMIYVICCAAIEYGIRLDE
jgi:UDP-N-acetylglucosamine transferase subunit ALG13